MTEAEWLTASDPEMMLAFIESDTSDRYYRLFGVACVARYVRPDRGGALLSVLRMVEQHSEGELSDTELAAFGESIPDGPDDPSLAWACRYLCMTDQDGHSVAAAGSVYAADAAAVVSGEELTQRTHLRRTQAWGKERCFQSRLLRDIVGNPFCPVVLDPSWRTKAVVTLAEGIYADRAFDRMPVLADALEDAGCSREDILSHCRGDGPHVRGCWVVDLLTGRK